MFQIISAPLTDQGHKRDHNEDWTAQYEPHSLEEREQSGCLYIVADGVGGAMQGERASQYATQKVLYEYYHRLELSPLDRLREVIRQAGNEIYQYAEELGRGRMATTMVAVVVIGQKMLVANVGDSRAYLLRGGDITQLTRDHSLVGEMIRDGSMTEKEALHTKVKNSLTRSLGGERNPHVDLFEVDIEPGDRILLTTDGLTRYATGQQIAGMLGSGTPQEVAEHMVRYALQQGGADNITVLPIEIGPPLEPAAFSTTATYGATPGLADWETMVTEAADSPMKLPPASRPRFSRRQQYLLFYSLIAVFGLVGTLLSILIIRAVAAPRPTVVVNATGIPTTVTEVSRPQEISATDLVVITPTVEPLPIVGVTPYSATYTMQPSIEVTTVVNTETPSATVPESGVSPVICEYTIDVVEISSQLATNVPEGGGCQKYASTDAYCISKFILGVDVAPDSFPAYANGIECKPGDTNCGYTSYYYHVVKDGWTLLFPGVDPVRCQQVGGAIHEDK